MRHPATSVSLAGIATTIIIIIISIGITFSH
jgi:hypothetical protein